MFLFFLGPVFCIGIHPQDEHIIITGGQDEKPFIWNTQTGEVLMESDKFSVSVVFILFYNSHNLENIFFKSPISSYVAVLYHGQFGKEGTPFLQSCSCCLWCPISTAIRRLLLVLERLNI